MKKFSAFNLLKAQFKKHSKSDRKAQQASIGFTLIELLVTMVIGSIVVGALLTFLNSILVSERQEQAKAATEHEMQAAADYIASDLQEAVYIYDADGIEAIKDQLPYNDSLTKVPVLVFWKRNFFPKDRKVHPKSAPTTEVTVGCLVQIPGATAGTTQCDNRDYFVYSLVAYYLIKESGSTWSNTARIGRWEIQDGIKNPYSTSSNDTYLTSADAGFNLFSVNAVGNFMDKMNAWEKSATEYDTNNYPKILVDYVDQSTGSGVPTPSCSNVVSSDAEQVPADGANPLGIYSFYACIDSSATIARVFLRGNALARIESNITNATYTNIKSQYFPNVSIQIQGKGALGDN